MHHPHDAQRVPHLLDLLLHVVAAPVLRVILVDAMHGVGVIFVTLISAIATAAIPRRHVGAVARHQTQHEALETVDPALHLVG